MEQKNQKFKSVIKDSFDMIFVPIEFDKDIKVCAVTGIESKDYVRIDDRNLDSPYVLLLVEWQAGLGKTLKDADYLLMEKGDENNAYLTNKVKCNNISFGDNTYLLNSLIEMTSTDFTFVKRINNTDFLKKIAGQQIACSFQFYGGNKQALNEDGSMKTFEDLATVEKEGKYENTYLGILRMDVDNLGAIFIKGLPEEQKSFAAYAILSFLLDYFFSGY
jgi:CRISPR-associated protein Csm1